MIYKNKNKKTHRGHWGCLWMLLARRKRTYVQKVMFIKVSLKNEATGAASGCSLQMKA